MSAEFRLPSLWSLLVCGTIAGAHAQGVIIDQNLQPPPIISGKSYHYDSIAATLTPQTGQEFTPSLNGLDFVDINLLNRFATNAGTFEIAIHEGNITAPVLGVSGEVGKSGGTAGNNTHFTFASTVPLVPGDTYVLEVLQTAGDSGWAVEVPVSAIVDGQTINMSYGGGRLIYGGVPQATEDMIFQQGILVPEPGASAFCLLGLLTLFFFTKTSPQTKASLPIARNTYFTDTLFSVKRRFRSRTRFLKAADFRHRLEHRLLPHEAPGRHHPAPPMV